MRRQSIARPSPALLVAVGALVAALAGTAVAGPTATTSVSKKQTKKIAKQQSEKQVNKLAPGIADAQIAAVAPLGGLTYVNSSTPVPAADNDPHPVSASCPSGKKAIGGGVKLSPSDDGLWAADDYVTTAGFKATVFNESLGPATAQVTVACVTAESTGSPPSS